MILAEALPFQVEPQVQATGAQQDRLGYIDFRPQEYAL